MESELYIARKNYKHVVYLNFFENPDYASVFAGSLLGVNGYGKEPKSIPVGSETMIDMYPLDFEEFLWANGIGAPLIEMLKKNLETETPVPEAVLFP